MLSQSIGHSLEQGLVSGTGGQRAIVQEIGTGFEPGGGHIIGHTGVHGLQQVFAAPAMGQGVAAFGGLQGLGQGFGRNVGKGLQHAIVPSFTPQLTQLTQLSQLPHMAQLPQQGGSRGLSQGVAIAAARGVGHTFGHGLTHAKASAPQRSVGRQVLHAVAPAGSYASASGFGSSQGLVRAFQPDYGSSFASPYRSSVHDDFAFGESKVIHGPTYLVHTFGTERDPYYGSRKSYSGKSHRGSKPYVRKSIMIKDKGRHRP
ncbi:hypothetical protein V5799_008823 [Amblyomma americanum]|uniref:Uncharacterized protein n=1 Tax=Amblyomma americanum TaxID=6943 RepID=A0AAQ4FD79_AMBAM